MAARGLPAAMPRQGPADDDGNPCGPCPVYRRSVCSVLPMDARRRFASLVSQLDFAAGEEVFLEGDSADHVYVVMTGVLKLYRTTSDGRRQITGLMFPGDLFGLALAESASYVCGGQSGGASRLCRLPKRKLRELMSEYPALGRELLKLANWELADAYSLILLLGRKGVEERLASFLVMLRERMERSAQRVNPIALPLTRSDIADYLGIRVETVSRILTRFQSDGMISIPMTRQIVLRDVDRLTWLSGEFA